MKNDLPNCCGIYAIIHTATGRRYVGSSTRVRTRMREHLSALRHNRHQSPHLRNAWLKYGEDAFSIALLEECHAADLIAREQHHIDAAPSLNARPIAERTAGFPHSATTKARLSALKKRPEYRHVSEAGARHLNDPAIRARAKAATKARLSNPDTLAKAVANMTTPEATAKRIAAQRTPEYRAAMSAANKGRKKTPEHRANIAAARRGKKFPNLSESLRKRAAQGA